MSHLFNSVTEDDFFKLLSSKSIYGEKYYGIMLGGEQLKESDTKNFVSQARTIMKLDLWKRLIKSAQWTSNEIMFKKSKGDADMMWGKAMLYITALLAKKIENIASIEIVEQKKEEEKK